MNLFHFFISFHLIGGVLVPFFMDWGGLTFSRVMILQSWFVLCVFLLEIPTGTVADYLGRKASVIIGIVVNIAAALLYSWIPNFYIFMMAEFLWAMANALFSGAEEALVYDSLKKIRRENTSKKVLGKFHSYNLLGLMVGAPIGSLIAKYMGLRYTMMLMFVPFSIALLISLTLKEPKIKHKKENYFRILVNGMKYFKNHRTLKILAFDKISIWVLSFMLVWMYQPLLQSLGLSIAFFGLVHAGIAGMEIVVSRNFDFFERIVGSKLGYLFFSSLIAGIGFIMLGSFNYLPLAIIMMVLVGGFGLTRKAIFSSYLNKHIESHNRATVLSTISMIEKLSSFLIYPIVGFMVDWSLNYSFIIIGSLILISAIVSRVEEGMLID